MFRIYLSMAMGVARKLCRGGQATSLGSRGRCEPPVESWGEALEADKISTYSFNFEVLEIQIN